MTASSVSARAKPHARRDAEQDEEHQEFEGSGPLDEGE